MGAENKSYRANFHCKNCRNKFYGRVQFKLKYDGLVVKKSILPIKELEVREKEGKDVCTCIPTKEVRAVAKDSAKEKELEKKQTLLAKEGGKAKESSQTKEAQNVRETGKSKEVKVKPRYRGNYKKKVEPKKKG